MRAADFDSHAVGADQALERALGTVLTNRGLFAGMGSAGSKEKAGKRREPYETNRLRGGPVVAEPG